MCIQNIILQLATLIKLNCKEVSSQNKTEYQTKSK